MAATDPHSAPEADLLSTLRGLGSSLLGLLHTRAELLALEVAEEKERLKGLLIPAVLALLFSFLGLQLLAFVVIVAFWDTYRLAAIAGITGVYLGIAACALLLLRHRWRVRHVPFAATIEELKKDLEALGSRHE